MSAERALKIATSAPMFQFERQQYAQMAYPFNEASEAFRKDADDYYYESLTKPDKILPLIIQQEEIRRGRELSAYEIRRAKLYADVESQITSLKSEEPNALNGGEDKKLQEAKAAEDKAKEEAAAKQKEAENKAKEEERKTMDRRQPRETYVEAPEDEGWIARASRALRGAIGLP